MGRMAVALLGTLALALAPSARAFATGRDNVVGASSWGGSALASSAAATPTATAPPPWDELAQSLEELRAGDDEPPAPQVTLYRDTNGWCPFCERVWLVLRAKGIPYDEQLVSLQNKPEWYKALVPTTLVPAVLFHGDGARNERRIVWESLDVMRALDEEFPDTKMLLEEDPAFVEAMAMNDDLSSAGVKFIYGGRNASLTNEEKAERRSTFILELDRLNEALLQVQGAGGTFRLGTEFTAVDALMIPTLERWRYQLPITAGIDILEGRPGLAAWFEEMDSYEPYASRVRGDSYSWTATNSMFLRFFGSEDDPAVAATIQRADEAAKKASASFVESMELDDDGRFALEAATKLIANHAAVRNDCTDSLPKSQQHIGRASDADAADLMLRHVASLLISSSSSKTDSASAAKNAALLDMDGESRDAAALAANTVASRLCVPRDMSAPAASVLRGVLSIVAHRLSG